MYRTRRHRGSEAGIDANINRFGFEPLSSQIRRAGGTALALLSSPLNVHILQALAAGDLSPLDLRRAAGLPPQSTMRVYVRNLIEMGTIEPQRRESFPPSLKYSLTPAGWALLKVGNELQAWLNASPDGPVLLGSSRAKSATLALVEGWSSNIVRTLASQPYSLTQLSRLNIQTTYPGLERRLSAMRLASQVEPHPAAGRGTPYRVTDWLRRATSPLIAATAWERKYLPESTPRIGRLDVEAVFLLAAPLVQLPPTLSGRVRLAVEVQGGANPDFAGAVLEIGDGALASCSVRLEGDTDASISGTVMGWLRQMNGNSVPHVEFGGDRALGETVAEALRAVAHDLNGSLEEALE